MNSLTNLNMNLNQILEAVLQHVDTMPLTGKEGELKYYTVSHCPIYYDGTEWKDCGNGNPDTTSITNAEINDLGHLILTISNGTEYDCGVVKIIPQSVDYILLSTGWSTDTYTISNEYILPDPYNCRLECDPTITTAQYDAVAKAKIIGITQVSGSITIKALGDVPTIDIPIKLIID